MKTLVGYLLGTAIALVIVEATGIIGAIIVAIGATLLFIHETKQ
jgi:hypothetical protein